MRKQASWFCILTAGCALGTTSCSWFKPEEKPVTAQIIYHEIDEQATVIPAKYSKEYTLSGNMVARYHDFDLALVKVVNVPKDAATKALPAGMHYFYEARNQEGFLLAAFSIGPQTTDEESVVKISRYKYHYSAGRTPGSIIIYLPYDQMAAHSGEIPGKNRTTI